jgi:hypothetical protein
VRLEASVDPLELDGDPVEPLEQRIQLAIGDVDAIHPRILRGALVPPAEPLPEQHTGDRAERVDPDVERRSVTALDERLVHLVAHRVERCDRDGRSGPPSSVDRLGTDESAKITAAQTTTGSQAPRRRRRVGTAGLDIGGMVGSPPHTERGEGTRCKSGTVPPL